MYHVFSIKYFLFAFFFLILNTYYLILNTAPAEALTMSNSNYILQWGTMNMAGGKPTGSGKSVSFTMGQIAPGLYSKDGVNYKVRSGFQYIYTIIPFQFQIINTSIDFGVVSPTDPVTRTSDLLVSNGSANGYAVTAFENHELLIPASGSLIPDTTCDNGTCTQTTSALWTNNLTYGFGYRCDNVLGTDCLSDFLPPTYSNFYKQFSDNSKGESAIAVMNGANVGRKTQKRTTITYKINISNMQAGGTYNNVITYIATPTF